MDGSVSLAFDVAELTLTLGKAGAYSLTVPSAATELGVVALGAGGYHGVLGYSFEVAGDGGAGGRAEGTIRVTPGETLQINVGGSNWIFGGFNGGAAAGGRPFTNMGGGGGGASDVRQGGVLATDRVIVAGGAGGGGGGRQGSSLGSPAGDGGAGGGFSGQAGENAWSFLCQCSGGAGGTQTGDGSGQLGDGEAGEPGVSFSPGGGGGGGGGLYGGGGGQSFDDGFQGGGGGGSGLVPDGGLLTTGAGSPADTDGSVTLTISVPDADQDGVLDENDVCPNTAIPESVPTNRLGVNRWALVDDDALFDTDLPPGGGNGPNFEFSLEDTRGCSCEQIIEARALGWGHTKFGCSTGVMLQWVATVWNDELFPDPHVQPPRVYP